MIGFITLTGIATRNGILKISRTINLAIDEKLPFGPELVMRGSLERMTPVLMTALSAGVALVPLMIDANAPGTEILNPLCHYNLRWSGQIYNSGRASDARLGPALRRESVGTAGGARTRAQIRYSRGKSAVRRSLLTPMENTMPRLRSMLMALPLVLACSSPLVAHEAAKGHNGGLRVDAGKYHTELLVDGSTNVAVFLSDADDKPIPLRALRRQQSSSSTASRSASS